MENKCNKCGAPMATSKAGKPYCSATCWLPAEEKDKNQTLPEPAKKEEKPKRVTRTSREIGASDLTKLTLNYAINNNVKLEVARDEIWKLYTDFLTMLDG